MDRDERSPWSSAEMVAGFAQSPPNETLIALARHRLPRTGTNVAVDIGCGAARNAVPLAQVGWNVIGIDASRPMLEGALRRDAEPAVGSLLFVQAPMHALPIANRSAAFIVAHGVWNLAASDVEFRAAIGEAARIAMPGAVLFVFTFSRHTIPPAARPVSGESFIFTEFSGQRQCFVTGEELLEELARVGFTPDAAVPLTEHNLPRPGVLRTGGPPVIYEAAFRYKD